VGLRAVHLNKIEADPLVPRVEVHISLSKG